MEINDIDGTIAKIVNCGLGNVLTEENVIELLEELKNAKSELAEYSRALALACKKECNNYCESECRHYSKKFGCPYEYEDCFFGNYMSTIDDYLQEAREDNDK